jgi:hypothetical protein
VVGSPGTPSISVTLPLVLAGPIERHSSDFKAVASGASEAMAGDETRPATKLKVRIIKKLRYVFIYPPGAARFND